MFADLSSDLTGMMPGLSGLLADKFITRAWRKVRDARLWSFQIVDDSIVCPAALTAGTYAINQYNNIVTADATASAAFSAISPIILPPQFLQLRFGGSGATGEIYNIVSVNTTVPTALVFTLDRVVVEPSAALSPYICYRNYVAAPRPDFLRWIAVQDMANGIRLSFDSTSEDFDLIDSQRGSVGQATRIGFYRGSTDPQPVPIYELWPGPTSGQTFYVRYRVRGSDFVNPTDAQPDLIPDDLIMQMALAHYAYPFGALNVGQFPSMAKVNWPMLITQARENVYGNRSKNMVGLLRETIVLDNNQGMQSVLDRGHWLRGVPPMDAAMINNGNYQWAGAAFPT